MLKDDVGRYRCALCGADLDVSEDAAPRVVIAGGSGKPNVRMLILDGVEIHRCDLLLPPNPFQPKA